jgi:hypothetical protein
VEKLALTIISKLAEYRHRKGASVGRTLNPRYTGSPGITCLLDSSGKKLVGTNRYILRFEPGEFVPPPNTHWSVTIWIFEGLSAISPIHHGCIDSSMLPTLQHDSDGRLTIYVQSDSPGQTLESNWLCTQNGQFMVSLKLCWNVPRTTTSVTWKVPSLRRTN